MLVELFPMLSGRPTISVLAVALAMAAWSYCVSSGIEQYEIKFLNNAHSGCDTEWTREMSMFPIPLRSYTIYDDTSVPAAAQVQ